MFQQFYPREEYDSTYEIPFEMYYQKGYRGVLFDVDNTLVEHDQPATARAVELFEHLRELGFQTCVISNNKDYRVKPFADTVKTPYVFKAGKPSPRGYQEGMKRMQTTPETTLFVGDQIFTDVFCARRAGAFAILVTPLPYKENLFFKFKRLMEKPFIRAYRKKEHSKNES